MWWPVQICFRLLRPRHRELHQGLHNADLVHTFAWESLQALWYCTKWKQCYKREWWRRATICKCNYSALIVKSYVLYCNVFFLWFVIVCLSMCLSIKTGFISCRRQVEVLSDPDESGDVLYLRPRSWSWRTPGWVLRLQRCSWPKPETRTPPRRWGRPQWLSACSHKWSQGLGEK